MPVVPYTVCCLVLQFVGSARYVGLDELQFDPAMVDSQPFLKMIGRNYPNRSRNGRHPLGLRLNNRRRLAGPGNVQHEERSETFHRRCGRPKRGRTSEVRERSSSKRPLSQSRQRLDGVPPKRVTFSSHRLSIHDLQSQIACCHETHSRDRCVRPCVC